MYNVRSGDSLAKKNGNYNRSSSCMYMCILENSLPDGIVLGVSDSFRGGCEMIHDHLCHFFLSEEVVREAWIWTWGLRSLEKKCEEERLGMYLIYIYI